MQVWNVLHATRWKCRTQKIAKNSQSGYHRTNLSGYIFATKSRIDNWKKSLLNSNSSPTSLQYGELRPISGWDRFVVWGTPANFNQFCVLAALLHGTLLVGTSQTLRRWTEGATYIGQGGHHVGPLSTFYFVIYTHKHTTTVLQPFVWDYQGEPVPEETLTHPPSWSSSNLYQLLSSTTIHNILLVQITCLAIFLHNLFPLGLEPSTSYSIHFFTQSVSSFRSTYPYHRNLFCCSINIISSIPNLSLNSLLGTLSVTLTLHIIYYSIILMLTVC